METAFNRAKELVSNLNILPSLKKCNTCELNSLSKNIFDSIRFNINSDTYSATDADSSSDSESDYDDETMESNEFNSDLINVDEEDKDAATTQSVDEIKTEKINFTANNIVEGFTTTANHFTVEEENDEFKWNDSISTLYNNTNGTGSSIITNYDPYLHGEYLQDVNNSAFFTSKAIVQEQELTSSNNSNYLNRDNSKTFESFTIQTEDHMNNWFNQS
ncbi:unnamed protein product, partial [Rotaria sp. Silwood1]